MNLKSKRFSPEFLQSILTIIIILAISICILGNQNSILAVEINNPAASSGASTGGNSTYAASGGELTPERLNSTTSIEAISSDGMLNLNNEFRSIYQQAKQENLENIGPIIIVGNGKATLIKNGKHYASEYIGPDYSILKTMDHMVLAIFTLLCHSTNQETLSTNKLETLKTLRCLSQSAGNSLGTYGLSPAVLQRQQQIFKNSLQFMDKVLTEKKVSANELDTFVQNMVPMLTQNMYNSIVIELSGLNKVVMEWKKDMSAQEWKALHVVVIDQHMPRSQNRTLQYFFKLLGEHEEGKRVVFLEGDAEEPQAVNLLSTHLLDSSIGKAFFKDPMRMHRDLLSDVAREYLREHPPQP